MINKIYDFITIAFIAVILVAMFCVGVFHILAYGIPLGIYKKDMHQVLNGIGMIGVVFVVLLGIKLFNMFLNIWIGTREILAKKLILKSGHILKCEP